MGSTKTETKTTTRETGQATPTPTPEETELNKLQLEQQRAIQPYALDIQKNAYELGNLLLKGQQLPGYLEGLPGGVSPAQQITPQEVTLGEDYTADIVQQALRDLFPQFQAMGLPIESGVAQSIAGRTSGDIRRSVAETNIERNMLAKQFNIETERARQGFNMGQLLNLLNLAVGGQAQIQQPVLAGGNVLGERLAGLRTINQTGTLSTSGWKTNPFLPSLYGAASDAAGGALSAIGAGFATPGGLLGAGGAIMCWVAKEIFGSWEHPQTIRARYYITFFAPSWFRNFYMKYGERIAKFIHNKPILKILLRPLFEYFADKGSREVRYAS